MHQIDELLMLDEVIRPRIDQPHNRVDDGSLRRSQQLTGRKIFHLLILSADTICRYHKPRSDLAPDPALLGFNTPPKKLRRRRRPRDETLGNDAARRQRL